MRTDPRFLCRLTRGLLLCGVLLLAAGCSATLPAFQRDRFTKTTVDSTQVHVVRFWVEETPGVPAAVAGTLTRRATDDENRPARLVITLRDSTGRELLVQEIGLKPEELPDSWGPHAPAATFRVALRELPAATTKIEVRAQDR